MGDENRDTFEGVWRAGRVGVGDARFRAALIRTWRWKDVQHILMRKEILLNTWACACPDQSEPS